MCVLGLTEDLEARVLKGKPRATHDGASHARRATALAETEVAGQRVSSETFPTENRRHYHYLEQGDLQEKFPKLNMYYCCIAVRVWTFSATAEGKTKNRLL